MNFYDTVSDLQYSIKEQNKENITIVFEDKPSSIVILFDTINKLITGFLNPTDAIKNLDDMTHQYALFKKMEQDLKTFESVSNYRRV